MKIVVLDGFAANPGDLSWEGLKALGECTIYDRTAPEEVLERAAGAEVILTNKVIINADHMAALPELKYIGVLATGYNVVDTAAAKSVASLSPTSPHTAQLLLHKWYLRIFSISASKYSTTRKKCIKAAGQTTRISASGILR